MPKIHELVVNPHAPVRAYKRSNLEETRDFKNLAEFEAWFYEDYHGCSISAGRQAVNSQFLFTDVLVDTLEDAGKLRKERIARAEARERSGGGGGGNRRAQRVIVDGISYRSVWAAFQALNLGGVKECVKFRTELKAAGSGEYGGKKFTIEE